MDIFAHHAHIIPEAPGTDNVENAHSGSFTALLSCMRECGIARAIVFPPFPPYPSTSKGRKFNPNQWLAQEIEKYPQLDGFGIVDFEKGELKKQVEELKYLGLKGIKIHPAVQRIPIVCKKAFQVYETAERLKLPISFHTGVHWYSIKATHPLLFDEVAHYFPHLKFSMEHVGGFHFFDDAVAVIMNNFHGEDQRLGSNIYAGVVSSLSWTSKANFWYLGKERVKKLIDMIGEDFVIFGLDFPHRSNEEIKESILIIQDLEISKEAKEKILGRNLDRFLNVSV